jgi:hypothetical protein
MKQFRIIRRKFTAIKKILMSDLLIVATDNSPEINFKMNGVLQINGRILSDQDATFWLKAHEWLANYVNSNPIHTSLRLQFDCVNTTSSLEILKLLYLLNELAENQNHLEVHWTYPIHDVQLEDMGKDFEELLAYKFIFDAISDNEVVSC